METIIKYQCVSALNILELNILMQQDVQLQRRRVFSSSLLMLHAEWRPQEMLADRTPNKNNFKWTVETQKEKKTKRMSRCQQVLVRARRSLTFS